MGVDWMAKGSDGSRDVARSFDMALEGNKVQPVPDLCKFTFLPDKYSYSITLYYSETRNESVQWPSVLSQYLTCIRPAGTHPLNRAPGPLSIVIVPAPASRSQWRTSFLSSRLPNHENQYGFLVPDPRLSTPDTIRRA